MTEERRDEINADDYIAVDDAAAILGVKKATIKHWCQHGRVKSAFKTKALNRKYDSIAKWVMKRDEIADFLADKEVACVRWKEYDGERAIDAVLAKAEEKRNDAICKINGLVSNAEREIYRRLHDMPLLPTECLAEIYVQFAKGESGEYCDVFSRGHGMVRVENPFKDIDFSNLMKRDLTKIKREFESAVLTMNGIHRDICALFANMVRVKLRADAIIDFVQNRICESGKQNGAQADASLLALA